MDLGSRSSSRCLPSSTRCSSSSRMSRKLKQKIFGFSQERSLKAYLEYPPGLRGVNTEKATSKTAITVKCQEFLIKGVWQV